MRSIPVVLVCLSLSACHATLRPAVLLEIRKTLARSHDRSRGKFRALLQTVVKRRVADRLRARKTGALEEVAAPEAAEIEALDLETRLRDAFQRCRDRFTQGKESDPEVL